MPEHSLPFDDFVLPFQLDSTHLRGRLVRLGPALDIILKRHEYPLAVAQLLAEAIVVAAALATALKFEGIFTLQVKSESIVRMLVADVTDQGAIRAYAQFDKEKITPGMERSELIGNGYLAFTVDQPLRDERYQGIVELTGGTLAEAVQHYFRQSEQVPTGIMTSVRCSDLGIWRGGCLLLQKMPREGGIVSEVQTPEAEDWQRTMILMSTLTDEELTSPDLASEDLLFRLFHEEAVRVYDPQPLHHQCRCSSERVEAMLRALPEKEIIDLADDGVLDVACEFCNRHYQFKAADYLPADNG